MKFLLAAIFTFLLVILQIQASSVPSVFIRNEGQWPSDLYYRMQCGSHRIWLGNQQISYQLRRADLHPLAQEHAARFGEPNDSSSIIGHDYRVKFLNSRPVRPVPASNSSSTRYNFFLGKSSAHRSGVQAFSEISYSDLYDGINLRLKSGDDFLKYDFELDAGKNGSDIKMDFEGVSGLELSGGRLRIKTGIGTLEEHIPKAFQLIDGTAREIACEYVLNGTVIGFRFPRKPDPRYKTVIDPLLVFFTYSGAIDDNWANTAVSDSKGNSYSAGTIYGSSFPTTPGVIDRSYNGPDDQDPFLSYDIGLLKFDSTGSQLLYCTFLGGSGAETPHSLTTDSEDNLILLGSTASPDFPVSPNAFQTNFRGGPEEYPFGFANNGSLPTYVLGSDLFLIKINTEGSQIMASTYLGGNGTDGIMNVYEPLVTNYGDQFRSDVVCASDGSVFIASHSHSLNFPTASAFRNYRSGVLDGIVARLSSNFSELIWSTYFGGSGDDAFYSLKLLPGNRVAVCGGTNSNDMPVRQNVWQDSHGGGIDGMIAVFEQNFGTYLGSTYSGTDSYDQIYQIETDAEGKIYIFGQTMGVMPRSTSFGDNEGGNYLQKYDGELSVLEWSCTFGTRKRQPNLVPTGLMLDSCGRIFLAGWGGAVNYSGPGFAGGYTSGLPVSSDAIKPASGDSSDFFFLVLTKNAGSMVYGTYLGANSRRGEHVDGGTSRFNRNGVITQAICGCRDQTGDYFRGTINAHEREIRSGNCNNGVMKLNLFDLVAEMDWAGTLKCPATLTLTNNSQNGETYIWNMGNGDSIVSNERIIQYVYENPGKYWLSIKAVNPKTCKLISVDGDSILIPDPFPFPNFSAVDSFCAGDTLRPVFPEIAGYPVWWEPQNFLNNPASPNPVIAPLGSILYYINIRNPEGCVRKIPYELRNRKIRLGIGVEKEFKPCEGITNVRFFSSRDSSDFYLWDFGNGETYSSSEVIKQFPGSGNFPLMLSGGKGGCLENVFDTLRLNNQKVTIMPDFDGILNYSDCSHPTLTIRNKTKNAVGYEWDFGDGTKSTDFEPLHDYKNQGTYRVILRAYQDGCIESASNEITVLDVLVPNLITFNKDDKNETLQIRGAQSDWGLDIYNRWGLPVYSTDAYQNNWKPEGLEAGIYFFTIRFPEGGFCRNWFQVVGP
jgi:PKD repeat protein